MCIIYTCESARPSDEMLRYAATQEPDYAGVAWAEKGMVRWKKGLEIDEVLDWLKTNPPFPYFIHFRAASVGGKTKELSQPFPISPNVSTALEGQAKMVLAHNGTVGGWKSDLKDIVYGAKIKLPDGQWSDTRVLALAAQHFGVPFLPTLVDKDRIVVLTSKGKLFHISGEWTTHAGYRASKLMTLPTKKESNLVRVSDYHNVPLSHHRTARTDADPIAENPKVFSQEELQRILQRLHQMAAA
jgi:hypothetical protein